MPIAVTDFEKKKYIIADAEFKLKKPTIGMERKGFLLITILSVKAQELENSLNKLGDVENIDKNDMSALQKLSENVEQTTKKYNEIFVIGEELFKLVLEPVKAGDESKLTADNIDEFIIRDIAIDFFTLARLFSTIKSGTDFYRSSYSVQKNDSFSKGFKGLPFIKRFDSPDKSGSIKR